jgi:prepilin-type N-terminal cleavage/methylation domain-containing protein
MSIFHQRAFTLIELLVVITIIAVLAAMVMPLISIAQERGRRIACGNSQRQIVTSCLAYSHDNDCGWPVVAVGAFPASVSAGVNAAQITARSMELLASTMTLQNRLFRCGSAGYEAPKAMALTDERNGYEWGWGTGDWKNPLCLRLGGSGFRFRAARRSGRPQRQASWRRRYSRLLRRQHALRQDDERR